MESRDAASAEVNTDETPGRRLVRVADESWSAIGADFAESTISRRFEAVAARRGDALAIQGADHGLTYAEVDARANRVARAIRAQCSALGRPVGILLPHDVDLVVTILAVMKAGGIVLVLDPLAPVAVNADIVQDAEPELVVTDAGLAEHARDACGNDVLAWVLDEAEIAAQPTDRLPLGTGPASPAMLAYSSGTTGGAKAAVLPHRALLHLTRGAANALRLTESDRLPMLFPVSMAVAAYPMLLPILIGGSLHIRDVRSVGLAGFRAWIADQAITVLYLSPTVARFLDDTAPEDGLPSLRLLVLGGERVDGDAVAVVRAAFGDQATILNGYGSTETGVLSFYVVGPDEAFDNSGVPVGFPIEDMDVVILSDDGRPVPTGETGELIVSSRYLCSGYWNRRDLTDRVLTPVPGGDAAEYRTGDLAFVDERGAINVVGRSDTEVKVAGHRVIPGEVEQRLLALPEVMDAVVEARPDPMGTNELVAWVVAAQPGAIAAARDAAALAMPAPMVPARFVELEHLPQLPNGKLDRRALPAPPTEDPSVTSEPEDALPATETEAAVAHILSRILNVSPIGVHTDLAHVGAQSLDIAWALVRVEEDLGVQIPMGEMVDVRTIAQLAQRVEAHRRPSHARSGLVEVQRGDPDRPRLYMVHDLHGSAFGLRHLAPALGKDQPVWGFESPYLAGPAVPFRTLDTLALRYVTELRAVQPEGPYHLAGYSFGGVLAFEIARQLEEAGDEVAYLAVIDVGPGYRGRHYDPRKVLDKPWLRVSMPPPEAGLRDQARWYAGRLREDPKDAALSLSIRSGMDRWLDTLIFQHDLRQRGEIAPGHRLWYAWRKHWELARRYDWTDRHYAGGLTLVWADESTSSDGTMGWRDVVRGPIDIIHVPTPHERMLLPEGAAAIGGPLRDALDRALSGSG